MKLPADATDGELLIKFSPEMTDILDQTFSRASRSGGMSRSGIPSTDEVLDILGAYSFERIFPVDEKNEARTREAGLHLWYRVKFDENTDLQEAVELYNCISSIYYDLVVRSQIQNIDLSFVEALLHTDNYKKRLEYINNYEKGLWKEETHSSVSSIPSIGFRG